MSSTQTKTDFFESPLRRPQSDAYSAILGRPGEYLRIRSAWLMRGRLTEDRADVWDQPRFDPATLALFENHLQCFGRLPRYHRRDLGSNNRSFFRSDLGQCIAQIFFMIHCDWCNRDDLSAGRSG